MNFIISGYADKRPIVYPLLYSLNQIGRTVLITDDTSYRRLIPLGNDKGDIGNVTILTVSQEFYTDKDKMKAIKKDYENVVCSVMAGKPLLDGLKIYALCDNSLINPAPEILEGYNVISVGFTPPKNKNTAYIPVTVGLMKELNKIERDCILFPVTDGKVLNVIAPVLAPFFGYNVNVMKKLMLRKRKKIKELY